MAIGASLAGDKAAWRIHIDGLSRIVQDRGSRGGSAVPALLVNLIIEDCINNIFDFPRVYHESIIQSLSDSVCRTIEVILYLLWPSHSAAHLTLLAGELKDAICRTHSKDVFSWT